MIGPTGAVRVMVATTPVDFRKGAEGLAALVREGMHADPFSGAVYVFRAKRADRVKLIYWNGTGVCLFAKRLESRNSTGRTCRTESFAHGRAALGIARRAQSEARPHVTGDAAAAASELICGTVNQCTPNARERPRRMV